MNETKLKQPLSGGMTDELREIRRQFQEESGGDFDRHVEQSNRVLEELRDKLGLTVVQPPPRRP
jgi:hypothetical protein